jgi:hypothetical protein
MVIQLIAPTIPRTKLRQCDRDFPMACGAPLKN